MLTRRNFVTGAMATGVLMSGQSSNAVESEPSTPVNFEIPAHACDCHTHFYGDVVQFPLSPQHVYTPQPFQTADMSALHRNLHFERVVIVTPSAYGPNNNASTGFGIKARGATARGIAIVDDKTTDDDFDALVRAGFRGARIVTNIALAPDPAVVRPMYQKAMDRFKKYNWMIEIYTNLAVISVIKDLIRSSPVPTVFDHFGGVQASLGLQQPGFADLLDLIRSGSAYIKISGAYRASTNGPEYPDVIPYAKAFIEANPDRVLWGTDWPHPASIAAGAKPSDPMPRFPIDDGRLLNQLPVWAPDAAIRKKILVDNPARLYGF